MKYFILPFLLLSNFVFGQDFSFTSTDTTFFGEVTDSDFDCKFLISNDSTGSFPMSWEMTSENMETGWDYSICDPDMCHPIDSTGGSFILSTSVINRLMNIHFYPNGNFGQSTVSVKVWQDNDPANFTTLSWTGVVSAAGLNETENNHVTAIYNNSTQVISLNFEFETAEQRKVEIIDLNGKEVFFESLNQSSGNHEINTHFTSGIYICRISGKEGVLFTSKIAIP